jgi:hypothetical protein
VDSPMNASLDRAWKNWIECLKGTDPNSIFSQITTMIWDTAIFRVINAGRQIQVDKNPKTPELNGALHSFINRNYFLSQTVCIRRLIDERGNLRGRKGVFSISALLSDIQKYRKELTRETFLRLNNFSYDPLTVQKHKRELFKQPGGEAFIVPRDYDWELIEEAHQTFDRLSYSTSKDRQPNDIISERVFVRLKEQLTACKPITEYVDKYVAHSSTPESRILQNYRQSSITLRHLWDVHKIIFEVSEFISLILFDEGHMALAFENPDFFDYWDKPIFEDFDGNLVRKTLEKYRKETEEWNQSALENTWKWIET